MKDYLSAAEVAELWNTTRQYVQKIARKLPGVSEELTQGKKLKIPIQSLFYGKHKDLILWGEPYKDADEWHVKKYTANGETECKIVES